MTQVFRLFISSTFKNWSLEREHLRTQVFPKISKYCEGKGARFLPVDLRWGVSESACKTHDAVEICLEEVHRCQRLTPKPNFLVMLGDRYGWRPVPRRLNQNFFDALIKLDCFNDEEIDVLKKWYDLDENSIPHQYCLHEIAEGSEDIWRGKIPNYHGDEYKLRQFFDKPEVLSLAKDKYSDSPDNVVEAFIRGSVTEQEVIVGAFQSDSADHVHCFVRELENQKKDKDAQAYIDWDTVKGVEDQIAVSRLKELKNKFIDSQSLYPCKDLGELLSNKKLKPGWKQYDDEVKRLDEIIKNPEVSSDAYQEWRMAANSTIKDYLDAFGEWVEGSLKESIDKQLEEEQPVSSVVPVIEHYVPLNSTNGDDALTAIMQHQTGSLLLFGEAGSGKSTLMSQVVHKMKDEKKGSGVPVLDFWIGRDSKCASGSGLIRKILSDLESQTNIQEKEDWADKSFIELAAILARYVKQAKTVIIIDAIDQLPKDDEAQQLNWIPEDGVFIISSLSQGHIDAREWGKLVELVGMDREQLNELLEHWLKDPHEFKIMKDAEAKKNIFNTWLGWSGRKLTKKQKEAVLGCVEKKGNPLHLRVSFNLARHWRSEDGVPAGELHGDVSEAIKAYYKRLIGQDARGYKHQKKLVQKALGCLAASRFGLSEKELLTLLNDDPEVTKEFQSTALKEYPTLTELPELIWSRLYHDLEPFIAERFLQGELLLDFYHAQFRRSLNKWLAETTVADCRKNLANMYAKQWKKDNAEKISSTARLLYEMPWMLSQAECTDELFVVMRDDAFLKQSFQLDAPSLMDALEMSFDKARVSSEVVVSANLFRKLVVYQPSSESIYVSERLEPWNRALWQLFYAQKYLKDDRELAISLLEKLDVSVFDEAPPANYTGCYYDLLGTLLFNNGLAHEMEYLPAVIFKREGLRKRYFESLQDHADIEDAIRKARNDHERLTLVRHFLDYEDGYNAEIVIDSIELLPIRIEAQHLLWHRQPDCPANFLVESILPSLDEIHINASESKMFSDIALCIEAKARFIASSDKVNRCELIFDKLYSPMWQYNGINIQNQINKIRELMFRSTMMTGEVVEQFLYIEKPYVFNEAEVEFLHEAFANYAESIRMEPSECIAEFRNMITRHLIASIKMDSIRGGTAYYDASVSFLPWLMLLILLSAYEVEKLRGNMDITSSIIEFTDRIINSPRTIEYISNWLNAWSIKYHASADKNSIRYVNLQKLQFIKNNHESENIITNMYGTDNIKGYALFAERCLEGKEKDQWLEKSLSSLDSLGSYSVTLGWLLSKVRMISSMVRHCENRDAEPHMEELKKMILSFGKYDKKIATLEIAVLEKELGLISCQEASHIATGFLDEIPFVDFNIALQLIERMIHLDSETGLGALELIENVSLGTIPANLFPEYELLGKDGLIKFKSLSNHIEYELLHSGDHESRAKEGWERLGLLSLCCVPNKHACWFKDKKRQLQDKGEYFSWQTLFQMLFSNAPFSHSEIMPERPPENIGDALIFVKNLPLVSAVSYFIPVFLAEYGTPDDAQALYDSFPVLDG